MKVLLDVEDNKAAFIMELLNNFAYVKATQLTNSNTPSLSKVQEVAIDQGLNDLDEGRVHSHEQVMEETRQRYPNLFK